MKFPTWARIAALSLIAMFMTVDLAAPASAADARDFDPGYIISDAEFYDYNSMTAAQIQSFLESKVSRCEVEKSYGPHDPIVCLKDYRMNTVTIPADAYCTGTYAGASNELASTIIYKVAQACGINPKVLLVTLQKEQGLVTHTWPSSYRYDKAMGFACPDTAPCDTQYFGFQNQVWRAARQFQRYKAHPSNYNYRAGMVNNIYYYPPNQRPQCGASSVYIENVATASLYNYTPYQPNQAALSNLYGTGNECSSYGNRNFWRDYSDWFGNPARPICATNPRTGIDEYWISTGGASGPFGALAAQGYVSVVGGMVGHFAHGVIVCAVDGGVIPVSGDIYSTFVAHGGATGTLGLPQGGPEAWSAGGVSGQIQYFAGGMILSSASTGTHPVLNGAYRTAWASLGGSSGSIGWPTGTPVSVDGGTLQTFQRGAIFVPTNGAAITVSGEIGRYWASGSNSQKMGRPKAPVVSPWVARGVSGEYQEFQNGMIISSGTTGTYAVLLGEIRTAWGLAGGSAGTYGWPIGDQVENYGVTEQPFQGGVISVGKLTAPGGGSDNAIEFYLSQNPSVKSNLGKALRPAVNWTANGATGVYRDYERGMVLSSDTTGTYTVFHGPMRTVWGSNGGSGGVYGWPIGEQVTITGGVKQPFQHGVIYASNAGVGGGMSGAIETFWNSGQNASRLKFPIGGAIPWNANGVTGSYQNFENGMVMTSTTTGTHSVLHGPVRLLWGSNGGSGGILGWPISEQTTLPDGTIIQEFQNGVIVIRPNGASLYLTGDIGRFWIPTDRRQVFGLPVKLPVPWSAHGIDGFYQDFENGMIMSSRQTGTHAVLHGPIRQAWGTAGGSRGTWGWPTGDEETYDGGVKQKFQFGTVYVPSQGDVYFVAD